MYYKVNARTMWVAPPFSQELSDEISAVIEAAADHLELDVIGCESPFPINSISYITPREINFIFHDDESMTVVVPAFDQDGDHFVDALVCRIEDPIGNGVMVPAPSYGLPHGEA